MRSGAALSVHKWTLSASVVRYMWQSHVGYFMLFARGRGVVALAVLVVLGAARPRVSRGWSRES